MRITLWCALRLETDLFRHPFTASRAAHHQECPLEDGSRDSEEVRDKPTAVSGDPGTVFADAQPTGLVGHDPDSANRVVAVEIGQRRRLLENKPFDPVVAAGLLDHAVAPGRRSRWPPLAEVPEIGHVIRELDATPI